MTGDNWEASRKYVLETLNRLDAKTDKIAEDTHHLLTMMAMTRAEEEKRQWWTRAAIGSAFAAIGSAIFNLFASRS